MEVPETPLRQDNLINKASKLFYTLEELESHRIIPEQEELLDKWIKAELALFQNITTPKHRGLRW
jgi:hypothetical protein